jgi:hypothetical protein
VSRGRLRERYSDTAEHLEARRAAVEVILDLAAALIGETSFGSMDQVEELVSRRGSPT